MEQPPRFDSRAKPFFDELDKLTGRYLGEGLDPALILCGLATLAIKTAQAEPQYKQLYLDYFAELVRGAGDLTILDE
jgi:hypothetical protein